MNGIADFHYDSLLITSDIKRINTLINALNEKLMTLIPH